MEGAWLLLPSVPPRFAEMSQYSSGLALARNTIDLYLSLAPEEANPVPVDDLVRGRVALSVRRHEPIGVVSAITPYNGRCPTSSTQSKMVSVMLMNTQAVATINRGKKPNARQRPMNSSVVPAHNTKI